MKWSFVAAVVLVLAGCDTLFPEFAGKGPDAGVPTDGGGSDDGGATPALSGVVCVLADLRDYRTCTTGAPSNLRITVEETRQATTADPSGHFTLMLSSMLTTATVAVVDPANNFVPTIVPVRLSNGVAANVALPIVSTQTFMNLELQNGIQNDPQAASFLGWAVDGTGTPVAGVSTGVTSALYDDASPDSLSPGTATHQRGAIAILNVLGTTTLMLTLTPPPTTPLKGDTFTLPLRAGALTMTTLVLPPK
jgi:hypothetical protein